MRINCTACKKTLPLFIGWKYKTIIVCPHCNAKLVRRKMPQLLLIIGGIFFTISCLILILGKNEMRSNTAMRVIQALSLAIAIVIMATANIMKKLELMKNNKK